MTTLGLPAVPTAVQRPAHYWPVGERSAATPAGAHPARGTATAGRLDDDGDLAWLGLVLYMFSAALVALFSVWLFS